MSRKRRMSSVDRMFYKLDREKIWESQGRKCKYCKQSLALEDATMDHVIPISRTGFHSVKNCVVACYDCNQDKADVAEYVKEPWEKMIDEWKLRIDERLKRFEFKMTVVTPQDAKGGYTKWKRYWDKRGRWDKKPL